MVKVMGMFDYVRSDYKIFGDQRDHDLQTKSFDSLLETIYVDPAGQLHRVDYSGCIEYSVSDEPPFLLEKITGEHGRVIPMRDFTGVVRVSATNEDNQYCSAAIEVRNGKILSIINKYT